MMTARLREKSANHQLDEVLIAIPKGNSELTVGLGFLLSARIYVDIERHTE